MVETLAALQAGTVTPRPQADEGVTYAAKISKDEARIDWTRPGREVDWLIRGLSPFPGAWCEFAGERVKVLMCQADDAEGAPGEVLDDALLVACGEGSVRLLRVQRAGRGAADAAEFLRGFPVAPGERLS